MGAAGGEVHQHGQALHLPSPRRHRRQLGRLDDKLAARFGRANVFKDVDSIPLGADFRQILRAAVGQCAAMLVVIGRRWLDVAEPHGRCRLDNPNDFVRIEIEDALARGIPVIPVLVQGAPMPRADQLGPSLAPLAYRHGIEVRGDPHFHRDADQLLDHLAPLLLQQHVPVPPPSAPAAPAALPVLDAPAARQPAWSPVGRVQRDTPAFPGAPADLADLDSEGAAASRRPPPWRAARRERRRTLQRVELLIGGVSALTLFLGQIGVALAVVWGIVATGLARTESYATGSRQSAGHVVEAARAARAQASAPARRGQGNGRMVTLYSVAAGSRDSVEHAQV